MLALKFWRRRFAFLIAALLLVVPASAQDPVDPDEENAPAETDDPSDPTDDESDFEEPEDFAEPLVMDKQELLLQASDIEEIFITGEKQNTLQDAPTSSTSFSAGDLQALRIENIADLADYTPNLEINTAFAASNPTIFIRGIGLKDYNANAAGAVAVYQDGVNINSPAIQLGQLFDIDGIDVLRGPQGSVNGRNATAGAIMIRSAMPDGEFGVSSSFTYGNYDDKEVEAAINIPLIEDMLSMRVSGTAQWRDGYTKNQCAGWNPEKFGKPRITQETTTSLYESLMPAGNWVNGQLQPVAVKRQNSGNILPPPVGPSFIFLDYDAARIAQQTLAEGFINTGTTNNPTVLAENLFDANGALIAPAGTRVGLMGRFFGIDDVDGICVINSPGQISTLEGEFLDPGDPSREEGYWEASGIQPGLQEFAALKPYTNNIDHWAARTVLLFEPLDNMEWMFNFHGGQNRSDSAHLQMLGAIVLEEGGFIERPASGFSENDAALTARQLGGPSLGEGVRDVEGVREVDGRPGQGGGDPFSGFYDSDGIESVDAWGINGHGIWDLGAVVITLLYDYEWYDRVVEDEGDATPLVLYPAVWSDSAWQTTEELRVEGEGERYHWTAGFFFLYEELDANNLLPNSQQFRVNQDFSQNLETWAPYLAGELDLVEEGVIPGIQALELSGGVRYHHEKKKFAFAGWAIGPTSIPEGPGFSRETSIDTWKEVTGDVTLSYTPFSNASRNLVAYLRYGRGFKSGTFDSRLTISGGELMQTIAPVKPEFNDALEFGIRTRWLGDRVILDAAVFRYWYQDLQVFDIINELGKLPTEQLLNSDADVLGAEAELRLRPLPGLLISGNLGWLDGEFKDFTVTKTIQTSRGPNPRPVQFNYSGNPLVAAPEWNWSVIAEYEIPLFGWGFLAPHYDFNYRSKAYFDPQMLDPISQEGYWLHNARIAYRTPDERIELAFWVLNIFEKEYKEDAFDRTRTADSILELWGEPRTYGVTLSLNW